MGMFLMKDACMSRWSWVQPLQVEEVLRYRCLAENFHDDAAVRFDPSLSDKQSNGKLRTAYGNADARGLSDAQAKEISTLKRKLEEREAATRALSEKIEEQKKAAEGRTGRNRKKRIRIEQNAYKLVAEARANARDGITESLIVQEAAKMVLEAGGLSRLTLFSDEWHAKNKTAAKHLFGYPSWGKMKQYVLDHFPARASENKLQRLWGSLGRDCAPVDQWKDIALRNVQNDLCNKDGHYSALDNSMSFGEFEVLTNEMCNELLGGEDAAHDDVMVTGTTSGLDRLGLLHAINEEDEANFTDEQIADKEEGGVAIVSAAHKWFGLRTFLNEAEQLEEDRGGDKKAPLLSAERLREQHEAVLRAGANQSGLRKLRQLERHERLHRLYEAERLSKCLLSYFLLVTEQDKHKLLCWMGSKRIDSDDVEMPTSEELPKLWLRLAKIPAAYKVLADKGFADMERDYPWMNTIETPTRLAASKGYRKAPGHIHLDRPLTSSRFSAETVFKRVYDEDILCGKIPYYLISILPYAHSLGHGEANLHQPFRKPGANSIVGYNYWANKVSYTRNN
ncbi:hypothetical protein ACHAWF_015688 [Thalassiosira exigua]